MGEIAGKSCIIKGNRAGGNYGDEITGAMGFFII